MLKINISMVLYQNAKVPSLRAFEWYQTRPGIFSSSIFSQIFKISKFLPRVVSNLADQLMPAFPNWVDIFPCPKSVEFHNIQPMEGCRI
jgi:hypothetical protein